MVSGTGCQPAPGRRCSKPAAAAGAHGCRPDRRLAGPSSRATAVAPIRWTGDFAVADIRLERLRGRAALAALRDSRRRAHSGPVRVHYDPALPADESRRVAYSVPRRVGKATERNRCRRRLREVARGVVSRVPPGAYLIGVEPGVRNVSFQELRKRVTEAMERASRPGET
jgi:ribonuclease P protein component